MKITIITVSFNAEKTIERTIHSVLSQKGIELEYWIIDGFSTDSTVSIIQKYAELDKRIHWISEKDKGIYDAMNKGISFASGDIIGILNADDEYAADDVLFTVCNVMQNKTLDSCYGNLLYIKSKNGKKKPLRYWKSGKPRTFIYGWMPPHPTFFVRKDLYSRYGDFRLDCGTAADYELMLRFFEKYKIKSKWVNKIFTYMEAGGASGNSIQAYSKSHKYDKDAWNLNELKSYRFTPWMKKIRKMPQFLYAKFIKIGD